MAGRLVGVKEQAASTCFFFDTCYPGLGFELVHRSIAGCQVP